MCRLQNIALESGTDRRTADKVIPMCRYASQATQKLPKVEHCLSMQIGQS